MINPTKQQFRKLPVFIIFPVILSATLFVMTIFYIVLPSLESNLMAQRRELIHELTEVAWSTLRMYEQKEKSGAISREKAQQLAIDHVKNLRYGRRSKDYFWINDMTPRIIMHPYRPDLEGHDVSGYTDPNGKRLFAECVDIVKKHGAGFVDYQWQWKDDPDRIVMKISFVKGFEPWGWLIGTGIYVDDIRGEIAAITQKLTLICLGILILVFFLSFVVIWQGIRVEKKRQRAEKQNQIQQEQLFQASKMASLGTLVSGVAHEINNPNTSILLNASVLQKIWERLIPILKQRDQSTEDIQISGMRLIDLEKRIPKLLEHMEDSAGRIRDIVSELKDFSRINPPEMTDQIDMNLVVEKARGLVDHFIQKSTDFFSIECQANIPMFRGNLLKIEQVIINLLINACQALENKQQKIEVRTGYNPVIGCVMAEIHDTGIGIQEGVLDRIKDPFFTTKQSQGNTGLGLAISDRIVQDHGGKMEFFSSPGRGTSVKIFFPILDKDNAKEK